MSAIETIIPLRTATRSTRPLYVRVGAWSWSWLVLMLRNRRTRRHLRDLSNASLEDVGLTRAQAETEASRSRFLF